MFSPTTNSVFLLLAPHDTFALIYPYSWAERAGIIDAIDLHHLPYCMGEMSVRLLNRHRRHLFDPPFILTPWREAIALHPLNQPPSGVEQPDEVG